MPLNNKNILIGVTGGIAAYKAAELVRLLGKAGANVRVAMTPAAIEFITPLTMQALSGNQVHTELLDEKAEAGMGHIELARWADAILVAPATADFIADLAAGKAQNLLTTVCVATQAPIFIAPAMNEKMWRNKATQVNLAKIDKRNIKIFDPAEGEQACGDVGPGRMREPEELLSLLSNHFETGLLSGKRVVITAGPTHEAIDPVRYIANRSSGKMGYALAKACIDAGAKVTLISGPTSLETPAKLMKRRVTTASEMHDAVMQAIPECDIFIAAAAVADFAPEMAAQKIKKNGDELTLNLKPTKDILMTVGHLTEARPFVIGFAAETENIIANAMTKLTKKNADMIIANHVNENKGFNSDYNELEVITKTTKPITLTKATKSHLATEIVKLIAKNFP